MKHFRKCTLVVTAGSFTSAKSSSVGSSVAKKRRGREAQRPIERSSNLEQRCGFITLAAAKHAAQIVFYACTLGGDDQGGLRGT